MISLVYDENQTSLYIRATVTIGANTAIAVIKDTHTNIASITLNGVRLDSQVTGQTAREESTLDGRLSSLSITDLVQIANKADKDDICYLLSGADMNSALSTAGMSLQKVGHHLETMLLSRTIDDGPINRAKIAVAAATDARMAGIALPAMSSGGSGNQGIVAILVPYLMGKYSNVPDTQIGKSLALSHLVNSYVKCFTGKLSSMCGCAVAAGVGASSAIVLQENGDALVVGNAINNVLANIAGVLCDGAKGGCALKVASSAETAIMSANLALGGYSLGGPEGIIGKTADETIANLGKLATSSDPVVNQEVLSILGR
ncbi:MAG: L-serine ammonia-lyase, iron-sulfur-dependent, subunit alpha [Patescibacteria group bacterium]